MQTQTYNTILADFDSQRANARADKNHRAMSAQQIGLLGSLLTGYARLAVVAGLVGLVVSVFWGMS